jgi:hypothetical protein
MTPLVYLMVMPSYAYTPHPFNFFFFDRGGFAWGAEDPGKAFNWHPLLMLIGLIFLYGNGKCT